MIFRFMAAAYGAAGVAFMSSMARDYAVINFSSDGKNFFESFYIVSMAAGFGVNAISLAGRSLGRHAIAVLFLLGVLVILLLSPSAEFGSLKQGMLIIILLMWLAASQWSRELIEKGWVFAGRVREAISSVVLAILIIFVPLGVDFAFLAAVAGGTVYSLVMWRLICPARSSRSNAESLFSLVRELLLNVALTNVATFLITYWALLQTAKEGVVFGVEISTGIRFSMYFYQILTIGSIVLINRQLHSSASTRSVGVALCASIMIFAASMLTPLEVMIFIAPFSAALMHFGMILFLQKVVAKSNN